MLPMILSTSRTRESGGSSNLSFSNALHFVRYLPEKPALIAMD